MKKIEELTDSEINKLNDIGMLYELYPELNEKEKIKLIENPDISKLRMIAEGYVKQIIKSGEYPDDDYDHYSLETLLTTFYGENIYDILNKLTN